MRKRGLLLVSIFGWLAACEVTPRPTPGDDDPTTDPTAILSIAPQMSEHQLDGFSPALQSFTATLTSADGSTRDVTAETTFTIDGGFGAFDDNQLSIVTAGKADVYATLGEHTGTANVIARLVRVRVDPSLPSTTPDLFSAAESPGFGPTVLYPPDSVSMPRNLGDFEIHWTGSGLDVFEASLSTEYTDVRIYLPGGNGVAAAGPNPSWARFTEAEWNSAVAAAGSAQFRVRGVSGATPGSVFASPPRTVQLSNEPMTGGIYYWASTAGQGGAYGIFRHDMSSPGVPAEEFMTTNQTSGRCIACHSLSRNGARMAVAYDGGPWAAGTVVDVATKTPQPTTTPWTFATFTPDGSQLLTIHGYTLSVRDPATHAVLATMPENPVTHPELSPDGTRLAYVRPTTLAWDWMFGGGQIFTRTYDAATRSFGPEQPLVTTGANNYYPSWSPDGQWIVFNRSDDASGNGAYDNPSATVWVVKADGSAPPIQLTAANQGVGLTNSWARFAPFAQTTGATNERMFWLTVSSKRDFGTRRVNSGLPEAQKAPQLWMIAFFPDRVGVIPDPGSSAFRLPFQSLDTRNHAAQWTEQVVVLE